MRLSIAIASGKTKLGNSEHQPNAKKIRGKKSKFNFVILEFALLLECRE